MISLNLRINVGISVGYTVAKITDRQAKNIKPDDKPIPSGITGFVLLPGSVAGRGRWRLRYVSPTTKKRRDLSLGAYPDFTVAAALKEAQQARELIAQGIDPIDARQEADAIPTFEEAATERWKEVKTRFSSVKTANTWINSLRTHIFPHIGHRRVDTLKPRDFAAALQPLFNTHKDMSRKVQQRCNDVMGWAWAHEFTEGNPLDVVDKILVKPEVTVSHHAAIPWERVNAFVKGHLSKRPRSGAKACLLFVILTAARSNEARGATWEEIDFDNRIWTIPGARMKEDAIHRVPLSDAAISLLEEQKEYGLHPDLIFPSTYRKQLSDMGLLNVLRKAKAESDTPGRIATVHGFRSSFRNWAADNGYSSDIAERALAHTIGNKTQAAYERTDRLNARIAMMQDWADVVMTDRDNVTFIGHVA